VALIGAGEISIMVFFFVPSASRRLLRAVSQAMMGQ
jgi:hypothetical protein